MCHQVMIIIFFVDVVVFFRKIKCDEKPDNDLVDCRRNDDQHDAEHLVYNNAKQWYNGEYVYLYEQRTTMTRFTPIEAQLPWSYP